MTEPERFTTAGTRDASAPFPKMVTAPTGTEVLYDDSGAGKELMAALAEAQDEYSSVKKEGVNPHLKYNYATLDAILESAKPVLKKHGLSVQQHPFTRDGKIGLVTLLGHKSGQRVRSVLVLPLPEQSKNLAQEMGKFITYMRRYAYQSVLGIAAETDTDAEGGSSPRESSRPAAPKKADPEAAGSSTENQRRALWAKVKGLALDEGERAALLEPFGVETTQELSFRQASTLLDTLSKMEEAADAESPL